MTKTIYQSRSTMALPIFVTLILRYVLEYLADNSETIINLLKDEFLSLKDDDEVQNAIQELGYAPTEASLEKLHELVKARNEDPNKIAKVLLNQTEIA